MLEDWNIQMIRVEDYGVLSLPWTLGQQGMCVCMCVCMYVAMACSHCLGHLDQLGMCVCMCVCVCVCMYVAMA